MDILGDIYEYFTSSSPSSGEGGLAAAEAPAASPAASTAAAPTASSPSLAAQAATIQAAIAKLSSLQPKNDPATWFNLAGALAAPTKTGGFSESLGNAGTSLGNSFAQNRELQMKALGAQASMLPMMSDLPLKDIQLKQAEMLMKSRQATADALGQDGTNLAFGGKAGARAMPAQVSLQSVVSSATAGSAIPLGAPAESSGDASSQPQTTTTTIYNNVSVPPQIAAQTARVESSYAAQGVRPLYDLAKRYATASFLATNGAASGDQMAVDAANKIREENNSWLKEGTMPGIDSSGNLVKVAIPGHYANLFKTKEAEAQGGLASQIAVAQASAAASGAESRKTASAQQQLDIGKEVALTGVKAQQEMERDVAKDLAKNFGDIRADAESARKAQTALDAMKEAHPQAMFGNGADAKLWIAKQAQMIGMGDQDRITASEVFDKNSAVLADELGSRGSGTDAKLANAMKANPSRTLSSEGAKELIDAATLRNQRLIDKDAAATEWLRARGNLFGFAQQFEKDHPLASYELKHDFGKVKTPEPVAAVPAPPALPPHAKPLPPGFVR